MKSGNTFSNRVEPPPKPDLKNSTTTTTTATTATTATATKRGTTFHFRHRGRRWARRWWLGFFFCGVCVCVCVVRFICVFLLSKKKKWKKKKNERRSAAIRRPSRKKRNRKHAVAAKKKLTSDRIAVGRDPNREAEHQRGQQRQQFHRRILYLLHRRISFLYVFILWGWANEEQRGVAPLNYATLDWFAIGREPIRGAVFPSQGRVCVCVETRVGMPLMIRHSKSEKENRPLIGHREAAFIIFFPSQGQQPIRGEQKKPLIGYQSNAKTGESTWFLTSPGNQMTPDWLAIRLQPMKNRRKSK